MTDNNSCKSCRFFAINKRITEENAHQLCIASTPQPTPQVDCAFYQADADNSREASRRMGRVAGGWLFSFLTLLVILTLAGAWYKWFLIGWVLAP